MLLTRWHLQDEGGGNLFLLAFLGSSLGALVISGSLLRAVALGSATIALAAIGISLLPASLAFVCMFLFGLGLGSTMTAISLLSQRRARGLSQAMVRLNLIWALGASLCPVLALQTLKTAQPRALLYPLAACFVLLAVWALAQLRETPSAHENTSSPTLLARFLSAYRNPQTLLAFFRETPATVILLVMLATGVEAAAGGWLATYAKRGGDSFAGIIAAPTCLWVGLLLSRFYWSVVPRIRQSPQERRVILASLILMAGSALTLLAGRHAWQIFIAALGLGLGAGPIYPLLLAKALRFHASGTIFFLAGVSSAFLPWLMGFVSTRSHSLHQGFYVPAIGCLIMVLLSRFVPPEQAS